MEGQTNEMPLMNEMYESALVSFGNFLLRKYGVKMPVVSDPKQKVPAEVTDVDIANWRHSIDKPTSDDMEGDEVAAQDAEV